MAVLSDKLYIENIEEYVKDENRIVEQPAFGHFECISLGMQLRNAFFEGKVTCKWLSRTLSVPVNAAKMMLYHYVSQYSSSPPLSVMYCVTGKKSGDSKAVHIQLVSGEELEDVKLQYSQIWSVHVYSVQLSAVKDSCALFASDYQVVRDHLSEYSKWNTISCDTVSHDQPQHTTYTCSEPTPKVWSPDSCTEAKSSMEITTNGVSASFMGTTSGGSLNKQGRKPSGKKEKKSLSKGSVSSFFNKKSSDDLVTKPVTKKAPLTANTDIGSVFDKSDVGNKDHSSSTEKPIEGADFTGLNDSDFEDDKDTQHKSASSAIKSVTEVGDRHDHPLKQKNPKAKSKAEQNRDTKKRKRRRRVQGMSSGDESDTAETGQDIAMTEEPKRAEEGEKPRRRRKRVRRLVSKMFLDDDGSMVTEKQWEEVSTDASSDEEKENGGNESPAAASLNSKLTKLEVSSPSKRTKQSSLMSFFKK